jgi:hypothetical protein
MLLLVSYTDKATSCGHSSGVRRHCYGERCGGDERCDGGGAGRAATSSMTAAGFGEKEPACATSAYTFLHDLGVFNETVGSWIYC